MKNLKIIKAIQYNSSVYILHALILLFIFILSPPGAAAQDSPGANKNTAPAVEPVKTAVPAVAGSLPDETKSKPAESGASADSKNSTAGEAAASPVSKGAESSATPEVVPKETSPQVNEDSANTPKVLSAKIGATTDTDTPAAKTQAQKTKSSNPEKTINKKKKSAVTVSKSKPAPERSNHRPDGIISLSMDVPVFFRNDRGYDFFTTKDSFVNLGASLGVDLWSITERWILSAELSTMYEKANSHNVLGGTFNTYWSALSGTGGVKLRFRLFRWLSPHARIWGGVTYTRAEWKDLAERKPYYKTWSPGGVGGAGLGATFHTPGWKIFKRTKRFPILSAGLLIEGGFSVGAKVSIKSTGDDTGSHPLDTLDVEMGTLSRNAPYLLMSAVIRI